MRKSILALTVVLMAGSFSQASTANAQGGRSGFGVAFSPVFGRHSGADSSILNRAEHIRQQQQARARADYAHERRREAAAVVAAARAARAARAAKAAKAAKAAGVQQAAAERKRDAAALTAQKQAQRQARVTVKPVKPAQVVKAPVAVPTATAASLAAPALEAGSIQAARPAAGGECKRFIPAAGVTITVPCTE